MKEQGPKLLISPCPHKRDTVTSGSMMTDTIIALLPAVIAAVVIFGTKAVLPIVFCTITAVAAEILMLVLRKRAITSADISSSVLTGLLLALSLPPGIAWYAPCVGAAIAIVLAKHFLGGLGYNIFNPAMIGRAFLMASWPLMMTTWLIPVRPFTDAVTGATVLALSRANQAGPGLFDMLMGLRGGCIGEGCAVAILIGAAYLFLRRVIEWRIPAAYILTVLAFSLVLGKDPVLQLLAGGVLLGAFFIATDPVTSPVTKQGRWVFGIGCGILTMIIRSWGGYPEGVCYAILMMNAATPLLERYLRGRTYGK